MVKTWHAFLLGLVRNAGALFHDVFITVAPHSISHPSWWLLCASFVPMLALKHTFILGWMTAACKLMMMIQLYNVMFAYCFGRFCTMLFWGQRSIMVRGGWSFLLLGGIIIYSLSKQSPLHIMWLENYMRSWSMFIWAHLSLSSLHAGLKFHFLFSNARCRKIRGL